MPLQELQDNKLIHERLLLNDHQEQQLNDPPKVEVVIKEEALKRLLVEQLLLQQIEHKLEVMKAFQGIEMSLLV